MPRFHFDKSSEHRDGVRRRDFLHAGSLSMLGLSQVSNLKAMGGVDPARTDTHCIFLMLVGGPSQLDTWDMKPNAPREIRGPYKPIKTNVPGIEISEIFPRTAQVADKFAIIRSMYHAGEPVHSAGSQLMQTGRLFQGDIDYPHIGCVMTALKGHRGDVPSHVLLPRDLRNAWRKARGDERYGQNAGFLGRNFDPMVHDPSVLNAVCADTSMSTATAREAFELHREPQKVREKYGLNRFGQSCLLARRLVEVGVRFVTVNMFDTVFEEITWDIHGSKPFSPIRCYKDRVGPMFDMAYSALLTELSERGLLSNTMVVSTGEFGRTPKINLAGGRDHWPHCWSMLMAGGGICGGQVVGSSDATGGAPKDRPTSPMEIAATIYKGLGIDPATKLRGPQGQSIPLVKHGTAPVHQLFV